MPACKPLPVACAERLASSICDHGVGRWLPLPSVLPLPPVLPLAACLRAELGSPALVVLPRCRLMRNAGSVTLFAFLGTTVSCFVIGLLM